MKRIATLALLVSSLGLLATSTVRAADTPACVTIILDCSAGMSSTIKNDFRRPHEAAPHGDRLRDDAPRTAAPERTDEGRVIRSSLDDVAPAGAEISKFDAARHVVAATLDKLSVDGNRRVALWLFGHRLAWEQKDSPGLLEQTAYLEQTLGFDVLKDLLPGDDVEMLRPLTRLEPHDLATVGLRLGVVKPWGECPLYLAIERAVDSHDRRSAITDRRVIVITCGDNHQGLARSTSNKTSVLDVLDSTPVPVHIIRVGGEGERQQESELNQIARASHGSYHRAATAAELESLFEGSLADEPATSEVAFSSKPTITSVATGAGVVKLAEPVPPPPPTLKGKVTYYKSPVKNGKVILEIGKAKRETKTDATGEFVFEHVPAGSVILHVEAVVQNKIRTKSIETAVEPTAEKPTAILIDLE